MSQPTRRVSYGPAGACQNALAPLRNCRICPPGSMQCGSQRDAGKAVACQSRIKHPIVRGLLRDCQVPAREEAHARTGLSARFAQIRPFLQIPRKETRSDATNGPDTGCSGKFTQKSMGHEPQYTPINHTNLKGLRRKGDVAEIARISPTGPRIPAWAFHRGAP